MACLECHYFSFVMQNNVDLTVVIPTPEGNEQITGKAAQQHYHYAEGLPVVYLLHGAYGDHSSWTRFSCIERYCQEHCVVGVMASARNSFYQDMAHGDKFFTFFTEELPAYITSLFPVSKKREDTYIAGLSMGGYGAWYLALRRPDLYCKSAAMSGVLDIAACYEQGQAGSMDSPFPWGDVFADPAHLRGSDADLLALYRKDKAAGLVPQLYHSCGRQDFLFQMNEKADADFRAAGADDLIYRVGEGMHNWDYWDVQIRDVLNWMLPLE